MRFEVKCFTILPLVLACMNVYSSSLDSMSPSELYNIGLDYQVLNQHNKSLIYFDKASKRNYAPAMLKVSSILMAEGKKQEAINLLEKAVKMGNVDAIYRKANDLCNKKTKEDISECKRLLKKSASSGHSPSYRRLGDLQKSFSDSYRYYLKAFSIDNRLIEDVYNRGKSAGYSDNKIVDDLIEVLTKNGKNPKDIEEQLGLFFWNLGESAFSTKVKDLELLMTSFSHFKRALKMSPNDSSINSIISSFYANGYVGDQNWSKAFYYLDRASKATPAKYNADLAFLYYMGVGTEQNVNQAIQLASQATELDFMAELYAKGSGVPQDLEKSANLLLEDYARETIEHYSSNLYKATQQDKLEATVRLMPNDSVESLYANGILYLQKKEYLRALDHLKRVTQINEDDRATRIIASLYARGLGVAKDYKEALMWLNKVKEPYSVDEILGINYLYGLNGYNINREKARELLGRKSYRCIDLDSNIPLDVKLKSMLFSPEELLKRGSKIKSKKLSLQECQEAYYYLLLASESNGEAAYMVGELLLLQWKIDRAKEFFEKSVFLGYAKGNDKLGFLYLNGYGTTPDLSKALKYLSNGETEAVGYFKLSSILEVSSRYSSALRIWLLNKSLQLDPSYFLAWKNLMSIDPRTGDKKYQMKLLEEACSAAKSDKSMLCEAYKDLRNGKPTYFDKAMF